MLLVKQKKNQGKTEWCLAASCLDVKAVSDFLHDMLFQFLISWSLNILPPLLPIQ